MTVGGDAARRRVPSKRRVAGRAAIVLLLFCGVSRPGSAVAAPACLSLTTVPDGRVLALLPVAAPTFDVTYIHSVTHTPVVETYRVDRGTLVETAIVFEQHGPGLPTEPDPGQTWADRDGHFVVTLDRRFQTIRMRVHRDQSPQLAIGARRIDLAGWGNRAIELHAAACRETAS